MRLFARRPLKPDVSGAEPVIGLAIIRRIKVTIDRYWVSREDQIDGAPERHAEPDPEANDMNGEGG